MLLGMGATPLPFVKVEGLSNDFLVVDLRDASPAVLDETVAWAREHAPRVCDRRRGVGGDGLLLIGPGQSAGAFASMIVVNADGSRPEMCGNGLRCVAAELAPRSDERSAFVVDTDAGPRPCVVTRESGSASAQVRVEMGVRRITGEHALEFEDSPRTFVAVDVGNPHAIAFVDASEDPEALARSLGSAIELHPIFAPAKTNVEFARFEADGSVTLWVWERGVGITAACGTGACATLAAAIHRGLATVGQAVDLRLPGGPLTIEQDQAGAIVMTGPARAVFRGHWPR